MPIIPFGKHKGKLVEELLETDPRYLDWLGAQPWFREQFTTLYQIIINRGPEPQDTPEHNALQCLFLDDEFCKAFLELKTWALVHSVHKVFEENGVDVKLTSTIEAQGCGKWFWMNGPTQYNFKTRENEKTGDWIHSEQNGCREQKGQYIGGPTAAIEIKPTIGDDYPAVLRQMRANRSNVLFLEQYTGVGATLEQLIQIFKTAGITIVFRHDLEK